MNTDLQLRRLAEQAAEHFLAHRKRLAIAESCTGGWLAKAITDIPGSSR